MVARAPTSYWDHWVCAKELISTGTSLLAGGKMWPTSAGLLAPGWAVQRHSLGGAQHQNQRPELSWTLLPNTRIISRWAVKQEDEANPHHHNIFQGYISVHSYGNLVMYPDHYSDQVCMPRIEYILAYIKAGLIIGKKILKFSSSIHLINSAQQSPVSLHLGDRS